MSLFLIAFSSLSSRILACSCSSSQHVTCGVPHGYTLGPFLFLMYVNDLPLFTKFSVTLYADDIYLMLSDNYLGSLEKR